MQYWSFILINGIKSASVIADLSDLYCTHEEVDTRLLFHASHSFHHGCTKLHATSYMLLYMQHILVWWFSQLLCQVFYMTVKYG